MIIAVLCAPATASAQQASATGHCRDLGFFVSIVDLANIFVNEDDRLPVRFNILATLVASIDPSATETRLIAAGQRAKTREVRLYLNDLNRFIQVRKVNGPQFGGWILNQSSFQTRHADMLSLSRTLCHVPFWDQAKDLVDRLLERPAATPSDDLGGAANTKAPLKMAATAPTSTANVASPLADYSQHYLLMSVFIIAALIIFAIYSLNYMTKVLRALRLDRYACDIRTTLTVSGTLIQGRIDVLGNRGLSFEVLERSDPLHDELLTLGREVSFATEAFEFYATLTKPFDGSAGFKLSVPLEKSAMTQLLSLSRSIPYRKLEMGRKKKPASPERATLVLNSSRSPAE